jgi:uncharacterized protein (TIGR03790 family)
LARLKLDVSAFLLAAVMALPAFPRSGHAEGLSADRLGVIYSLDESASRDLAQTYAAKRGIPAANVVGIHLPDTDVMSPEMFTPVRGQALAQLPTAVQSLLLVWSKPYAVGCMSITTAFAAGYRAAFCESGCALTALNPLFDTDGWLPADTVGWWPAMLLPTNDRELARSVIQRGAASDATAPPGIVYLVRTQDAARNVRAAAYDATQGLLGNRIRTLQLSTPISQEVPGAIGYFTGATKVDELSRVHFRPGAVADHLTSTGGVLYGGDQMSALAWLKQGATGSYGSVSEPCNHPEKFPSPAVFFNHYLRGETLLEAYWKSVAMPGQGLFIGEPLARPYATPRR